MIHKIYTSHFFNIKINSEFLNKKGKIKNIPNFEIENLRKKLQGKCNSNIKIGSFEHKEIQKILNDFYIKNINN